MTSRLKSCHALCNIGLLRLLSVLAIPSGLVVSIVEMHLTQLQFLTVERPFLDVVVYYLVLSIQVSCAES